MPQVANRLIPVKFQELYRPHRYKVMKGGRGSAKSHSVADYLISSGVQRRMRFLCAREIQKSISTSVHQLLVDKIESQGLTSAYKITRDGIRGPHDTHFMFAGLKSNPDSVKSMEDLDGAWIEEADRCSQASLDLLTPTLRNPKSEGIFTYNPKNPDDPVHEMFANGQPPPDTWIETVNWRDNPWFPKVLFDEMSWMKLRDYDKYLHVWEGHVLNRSEAKVFPNWEEDDLDSLVGNSRPLFGADWGFSTDPTVLVKCYVLPGRILYIAREVVRVKCPIDETPALFAGNCRYNDPDNPRYWKNPSNFPGIDGAYDWPIVADSARPETIAYMKARGFNIKSAIKGARSVEEGVEFVRSLRIVVHPSCIHTMDELSTYSYKVDSHTDEILPVLKDKDNHVIDAIRYALESIRRRFAGGKQAMLSSLTSQLIVPGDYETGISYELPKGTGMSKKLFGGMVD